MQNIDAFSSEKSVAQLWLKLLKITQLLKSDKIRVIRLRLHSYPWFSRPIQLWLDSFELDSIKFDSRNVWVEYNPM